MVASSGINWCKIFLKWIRYIKKKRESVGLEMAAESTGSSSLFPAFVVQLQQTPTFYSTNPSPTLVCLSGISLRLYTPECYHLTQRLNSCAIKAALQRCIISMFPLIPSFDSFSQKQTPGWVPNHKLGSSLDTSNPNYFSISRPANLD